MKLMSHERMKVYQKATEYLALSAQVIAGLPRGNSGLSDQLKRASLSIPLNIAEACGKTGQGDNKRFFSIARGSTLECAAILDACKILSLAKESQIQAAKSLLFEIAAMLTVLYKKDRPHFEQDQNQDKAQAKE